MGKATIKIIFSLAASLVLFVSGCSSGQEPGSAPITPQEKPEIEVFSKTMELNKIVDLDTMKLRIINVSLVRNTDPDPDAPLGKIALGIEIGNTSDKDVLFYPEDFEMTIDGKEIASPDLTLTSSLGGTYPPQRVQQGFITFPIKEKEVTSVKELHLTIPPTTDQDGIATEAKEYTILIDDLEA
ncbi:hypothetical protein DesLBE_3160 [Desulfitobacterium sp. LBE]|uniref:DUF4352 domain-containing protein n=5 Tax=root TaxID=1 RepID=Q251K0_DESHY|nr:MULTISPECIES: hypothetical protein [Desulfitobacterium]ACL18267.1 hypothetical protein Dhaf_0199 [Desulfitobacterium hafniense DCB-2]EHL09047.1 hypothetical protein HMPREF0322_00233 [Desulfitobacterium hafniense DP7]KTE92322.1 hypothetical protein AT727_20040 [Desulfitobacterium hafniense]MEA5024405.1 hypothetical protein [Desulfitobacterium hafniense]TWH58817.1 hypothetical protein DesLBE_3160 [Desulfitobacterium sp. LBE]